MPDRPNVLLICTDHWPGRMIGGLGHHSVLTPTLDQFMANGVAYTNAYTTTPMCVPARRELMTGVFSQTHGDRTQGSSPMPELPTIAQTFRDAGYQAYGVGKLHIRPPRNRIGFDDVLINEEGRLTASNGEPDDYEMFLTEQGYPGLEQATGIHNAWDYRPFHLPERLHHTNWTAQEMSRFIARRDPTRPAFWYMSFTAPHPPTIPLEGYMNIYQDIAVEPPVVGDWAADFDGLPFALKARPARHRQIADSEADTLRTRRAFYALATHVDHQIRAVVGTLREQGVVDDTIIMFTSDHGDMEGNHRLWNKMVYYEGSAKIPMILTGSAALSERVGFARLDDRLVAQADVMPTLLDLCDIPVPDSVEGVSMVDGPRREYLYGQFYEDEYATRMVHDGRHKLIYYAVGNHTQLFDLERDPDEMNDVADDASYWEVRQRLSKLLMDNLYGSDLEWLDGDRLVGLPDREWTPAYDHDLGFSAQRGYRFR
jgi:arylsulfatase A-like enzyme